MQIKLVKRDFINTDKEALRGLDHFALDDLNQSQQVFCRDERAGASFTVHSVGSFRCRIAWLRADVEPGQRSFRADDLSIDH